MMSKQCQWGAFGQPRCDAQALYSGKLRNGASATPFDACREHADKLDDAGAWVQGSVRRLDA